MAQLNDNLIHLDKFILYDLLPQLHNKIKYK